MFVKVLLLVTTLTFFAVARPKDESSGDSYVSRPITKKNYKRVFEKHDHVFVKFFTNWCFYSKQIFDIWESVGEHYANIDSSVTIAEVDCEPNKSLCKSFKIFEYPTLVMFRNGIKFEKYVGIRTQSGLIEYVEDYLAGAITSLRDET